MRFFVIALIFALWQGEAVRAKGRVANIILPRLLPKVENARLQRLFSRVGIRTASGKPLSEDEVFNRRHEIFHRAEINKRMAAELAKVDEALQAGRISKSYARKDKHQIELARDKIFTSMADKEHAIRVAEIEHKHDFHVLGLSQPVFRGEDIFKAYSDLTRSLHANEDLSSQVTLRDADNALLNIQMTLLHRLRLPQIIHSRADMRAKIRELSAEHSRELEMFGVRPNRKDTFSRRQLEKIEAEINRRFPVAQRIDSNPNYTEARNAYIAIYRATDELAQFRIVDGWSSAMFAAIIDRRAGLYQEAELLDWEMALQSLKIDLTDSKVSTVTKDRSNKMPSFKIASEWEQMVTAQHDELVATYRDRFSGERLQERLQELRTAKDMLISVKNTSPMGALLIRAHYEKFYRLLGLDPKLAGTYTETDITKAYRMSMRHNHPDKYAGKSAEEITALENIFFAIADSGKLLRNPNTKSRIDAYLGQ